MPTLSADSPLSNIAIPKRGPAWLRRIGCISTSRADSGIYQPLLRALAASPRWRTCVLAGGTHYDESYGSTGREFDDLPDLRVFEVHHFVRGDRPEQVARTAGQAVIEFSRALSEAEPDLVFVLGDRTEMLAASLAATIHQIPIAHLHGGDATEGAYDDQCRHAITKLAHLHFPALPEHAERIAVMGEPRWRIHTVGALALDSLCDFEPEPLDSISHALGLDFGRPTIVVAYHPETLSAMPAKEQIEEVLAALAGFDANFLLIAPNCDVGRDAIDSAMRQFAASRPAARIVAHIPQPRFWSCLAHAALLVGNSSAGIIEAASFRLPVVNIGDRQKGRVRAANVIDAPIDRLSIKTAMQRGISSLFRQCLEELRNPYGDGCAARRIVAAIESLKAREYVLAKSFEV